jgi:uncharacterized metal-binding protein YceD (DUF177 family)
VTETPETPRIQDASIRIDSMPPTGRDLKLAVGGEERTQLASLLGITEVQHLEIDLHAVKFRGGVRVTGRLSAAIVQPSVVTLEPVRQEIEEPIDRIFLPGNDKPHTPHTEVFVDIEGEDLPDRFEGPEADLSGLIIETLALAIDPYPRAEGESIEALGLPEAEVEESPFARLKSLKKPGDKG